MTTLVQTLRQQVHCHQTSSCLGEVIGKDDHQIATRPDVYAEHWTVKF